MKSIYICICLLCSIQSVAQSYAFDEHMRASKQTSYWQHLKSNSVSMAFQCIAGGCDGAADVLQFKYSSSVFPQPGQSGYSYWNPEISWRRKYANGNPAAGEAFFLSTTSFVFLTDGWHLMKSGRNLAWGMSNVTYNKTDRFWWKLADYAIIGLMRSAGWHFANKVLVNR